MSEDAMPKITTPDGETVVLGDISIYDSVILRRHETDYGVGYNVYTEVEGAPGAYYLHYAGKMIAKGQPDCEMHALMDAEMWTYSRNSNCAVVVG